MKIAIMSFAHHHAEAYVGILRELPGVELAGVADDDSARGSHFARTFDVPYFDDYGRLLAARPDGVIICSETARHRAHVEQAAVAGVPVLCEKPLATTVEDGAAIVRACRDAGVQLMTAFPMRFSAPLLAVREQLLAGDLGEVYCFNATNRGELPTKYRDWFVDPALAGGGAVMDHTVHLVDIMRWFLGSEVAEVYATTNRIFHADEVAVETGALEMITFEDGVFATIDASWSRPPYWPTWGGLDLELVTDRGAIFVDAFSQNLILYQHKTQRASWLSWGSDANRAMLVDFIEAIRDGREPRVSGVDGLRALEVAVAAYASAEQGQVVPLTPVTV